MKAWKGLERRLAVIPVRAIIALLALVYHPALVGVEGFSEATSEVFHRCHGSHLHTQEHPPASWLNRQQTAESENLLTS